MPSEPTFTLRDEIARLLAYATGRDAVAAYAGSGTAADGNGVAESSVASDAVVKKAPAKSRRKRAKKKAK